MKLTDWFLIMLVGLAGGVLGFTLASHHFAPAVVFPATPVPILHEPVQPEGAVVRLVAVVPDGTRVYRIEGPDMIVPAVLAVSPQGKVAFR